MQVRIPQNDIEAHQVAEIHQLSGWGLAGYVASQVTVSRNGGDRRSTSRRTETGRLTPEQFAAKGIRGLRSGNTVRLYAERWAMTGLPVPKPGQVVEVDLDWPPTSLPTAPSERDQAIIDQAEEDHVGASKAIDIVNNRKAMMSAIKADPETARAAAKALAARLPEVEDEVVVLGPEFNRSQALTKARSIETRLDTIRIEVGALKVAVDPDEWDRLRAMMFANAELLYLDLSPVNVPDTIEDLL